MTTETILTDREISQVLSQKHLLACPDNITAYDVAAARAIEQAVMQSEQVQALRKDSERYRWLRDMIENQDLVIAKVGSWSLESWSGDDPDHYIDAAMEQQK